MWNFKMEYSKCITDYDINKIKKDIYKIVDMFNNWTLLKSLSDISKLNKIM